MMSEFTTPFNMALHALAIKQSQIPIKCGQNLENITIFMSYNASCHDCYTELMILEKALFNLRSWNFRQLLLLLFGLG